MNRNGLKVMYKLIGLVLPLVHVMIAAITMGVIGFLTAIFIIVLGGVGLLNILGFATALSLKQVIIGIVICAVLRGILRYAEQGSNHYIAFKLLALIRHKVFIKIRKLAPSKLEGKDKGNLIYAPCRGRVVPLAEVPDPVFADKVLGDGFAVIPAEGRIYAPADGEVAMVFDTLHAVTLTSTQGAEILIHIGLDTVTLKGEPFKAHVAAGDKVKKGDLLIEADLDKIEKAGLNTIIPVLICNTDDYGKISLQKEGDVSADEAVLKLS